MTIKKGDLSDIDLEYLHFARFDSIFHDIRKENLFGIYFYKISFQTKNYFA